MLKRASSIFQQEVEAILLGHLDNSDFGVLELAQSLNLSRVQLYRKFMKYTGQTPTTFLREYKLKKGREMILQTNKTMKEIAFDVGFKDPAHFTNAFKALFKLPPSHLRK